MTRDGYDVAQTAALAHAVMEADAEARGDKFLAWKKPRESPGEIYYRSS